MAHCFFRLMNVSLACNDFRILLNVPYFLLTSCRSSSVRPFKVVCFFFSSVIGISLKLLSCFRFVSLLPLLNTLFDSSYYFAKCFYFIVACLFDCITNHVHQLTAFVNCITDYVHRITIFGVISWTVMQWTYSHAFLFLLVTT